MGFSVAYSGGGVIDKVRELPYPHFSKFTEPFIRGRMLDVTASKQVFSDTYALPYPTEFLSVAFATNNYCVGDYWELSLDGVKVCETIYTKELPESVSMGNSFGIVYPLKPNAQVRFDFHNITGTEKKVWYNVKFLRKKL
ncbi:hypothetical protein [Brevibacillus brevis]|uniref:Low copy number virion structural protein n=1 Tax=Brevibacillus brevis TaxID=1393 RepID=A0A517IBL8_BREBE|nr:hypothetical protein [Brevibacillus brevis]QDS36264.1 hypothetical protein FPS98_20855 [Brevibacillus brevis]